MLRLSAVEEVRDFNACVLASGYRHSYIECSFPRQRGCIRSFTLKAPWGGGIRDQDGVLGRGLVGGGGGPWERGGILERRLYYSGLKVPWGSWGENYAPCHGGVNFCAAPGGNRTNN